MSSTASSWRRSSYSSANSKVTGNPTPLSEVDTTSRRGSTEKPEYGSSNTSLTITTIAWSIVCPNYSSKRLCIPQLITIPQFRLYTLDYLFPCWQTAPPAQPKIWMMNILLRKPDSPKTDFLMILVLCVEDGTEHGSRLVFRGDGRLHGWPIPSGTRDPCLVLGGRCDIVTGSGTGIFASTSNASASVSNSWGGSLIRPAAQKSFIQPMMRVRPALWTFQFDEKVKALFSRALDAWRFSKDD